MPCLVKQDQPNRWGIPALIESVRPRTTAGLSLQGFVKP